MRPPTRFAITTLTEVVPRSMPTTAAPSWRGPVGAVSVMIVSPPSRPWRAGMPWAGRLMTWLGADHDLVGGRIVRQGIERLAVVVEPEAVGDHPVGPDPAVAHGLDGGGERGDLRERPLDRDLAPEHVEGVELDGLVVAGDPVDQD